jgi:hypothetical protein
MRWCVPVLARLAIAAACTSSAAALDARATVDESPSSTKQPVGASHVEFTSIGEQNSHTGQQSGPRVAPGGVQKKPALRARIGRKLYGLI